ncbi:hypothetical protein BSKO_07814 [Bryopsis sp. KO-2023]|nr:hypothetical protein BSKO_07814 [Bryopsis sp. KO-2023]
MAAQMTTQKLFLGAPVGVKATRSRASIDTMVVANSKKTEINKQGLNSIKNATVKQNLMGVSSSMDKKGWVDPQGRKGKGLGVYKFAKKYGANVDGYSPIYTPDIWSESGEEYSLGTKGLLAWAGLLIVVLGVGINLVVSTSQLGQ